MRFEAATEINADPERVWAVLTDVTRWPEWTDSVRRAEQLDAGPLTVGSEVRLEQPRLRPAVWRVTELVAPRTFTWESRSPGVRSRADHRLTPLPDGRVRLELVLEQSGPLAPVLGWLGGGVIRRYLSWEASGLARRCEDAA